MKNTWVYIVMVVILALGAGYLVMSRGTYVASSSPTSLTTTFSSASSQSSQQVTVTGNEFAFSPSTFTVSNGQPVSVTFINDGNFPHNLTIADFNVKTKTVQPGEQDTVTFTPAQVGQFAFTCTVDSHADKGMTGTFTVTP